MIRDRHAPHQFALRLASALIGFAVLFGMASAAPPRAQADPIFEEPPDTVTEPPPASQDLGEFHPRNHVRIWDTRTGLRTAAIKLGDGDTRKMDVTGVGGVPSKGVAAVVLDVRTSEPTAKSDLTLFPAGSERPGTSNLSFTANQRISNLVTVKVGTGGEVKIHNRNGRTHVTVSVVGWYAPPDPGDDDAAQGSYFRGRNHPRIFDSRTGLRTAASKLGDGEVRTLDVTGEAGIPSSNVRAVALNVTSSQATANSDITVYPAGSTRPATSNLVFEEGQKVSNLVIVKVGTGGRVKIHNRNGKTHVTMTVAGWYATDDSSEGGQLSARNHPRVLDTRTGLRTSQSKMAAGNVRTLDVTGIGGVPRKGVAAVLLSVTASDPSADTGLTLYPRGSTRPGTPNLNITDGNKMSGLVAVQVGPGGDIKIHNQNGRTHVTISVAGWFAAAGGDPDAATTAALTSGPRPVTDGVARTTSSGADVESLREALRDGRVEVREPAQMTSVDHPGVGSPTNLRIWEADYARTAVGTAIGRLYLYADVGGNWVQVGSCSASVVARDLVLTAAHCVAGNRGGVLAKWDGFVFVPGQYGTSQPLGAWASTFSWVDTYYTTTSPGFYPLDYGFIEFKPEENNGLWLADYSGQYPVMWNSPGGAKWSYGYPGEGWFYDNCNGNSCFPYYCYSPIDGGDNYLLVLPDASQSYGGWWEVGFGCYMTGGGSGGPVFEFFNNQWHVSGVNSHITNPGQTYTDGCNRPSGVCFSWVYNVWSPYFNDYFGSIYNQLRAN